MMHVPKPGAGGEEHSDWFWQRRAWPNDNIAPGFYQRALAEAAQMPVLSMHTGKDGTLASMNWQSIGPNSIDGRITCIATHPTDSNTFYVGAASGGLWKTTDHGQSWACVTDTFGSLSIGCVTLDATNPQTIYLGLGECNESGDSYGGDGLWKSIDGGNSWNYLGFAAAQYIAKIIIDPNNHSNLFIAVPGPNDYSDTNRGIFRSTDGGATWTKSLAAPVIYATATGCNGDSIRSEFIDIAMDPGNSNRIVAAAWDHSITIGPGFCPGGSGGPNTGIYLTIDTGKSWQRIDTLNNGLPNGKQYGVLGRIALAWSVFNTDSNQVLIHHHDLFAGYIRTDTNPVTHVLSDENFEGLYRSSNFGFTWQKVLDSTIKIPMGGVQFKDSANITNAQGGYDFFLTSGPLQAVGGDIYLGGIDIFRSTDQGISWNDITDSYSQYYVKDNREQHSDQHGLAFTAATTGTDMIVVSDGGVFNTRDYGTTWSQTKGLPITMFYQIEPWAAGMANTPSTISATDLRIMGGTQDNGTVVHGLTANNQSFGTDSDFAWVCQGDGGYVLSPDTSKMIASAAIGQIFARNTLDSLVPNPLVAHDTTHDTLPRWHALSSRLLYGPDALTDTTESAGFIVPMAIDPANGTDLYTGRCHVYRSALDWNDLENTRWYRWSSVLAGNPSNDSMWGYGDIETLAVGVHDASGHPMLWAGGYSAINGAEVWRTTVNPARSDTVAPTWESKKGGIPAINVAQIVPDRSDSMTAFLCTSSASADARVMKTTNGGTKWTSITGNLPEAPVSAIVIDTLAEQGNPAAKNQCLIAGTDVGVFVTTNGGAVWEQLGEQLPHSIISDLKMYKNMLVASVYGRSIWALDISGLQAQPSGVAMTVPALPTISIYPNPASGTEPIDIRSDEPANTCTMIEESSGRTIQSSLETNGDGSYRVAPSETLAPGDYLIELFSGTERTAEGRVAIVR